jgi:pyridoxal phosphate enzyme (YggS family)
MELAESLQNIQRRMREACDRSVRDPSSVTLLAVTKGQPPEAIMEVGRLGLTLFGENKIQEAKAKIPLCSGLSRWQMIGHLQSNKVRDAIQLFEMIQSVDSLGLAEEISKRAGQAGKTMPILLEVNLAGEASKFGYKPESLLSDLSRINALPRLEIHGLMTVPPYTTDPNRLRPIFKQMRELKQRCEENLEAPLLHLSMGMSGDFEIAIEEGATIIRIGTALFGTRARARNED